MAEVSQETSLSETDPLLFGVIPPDERGRQNWIFSAFVTDSVAIEKSVEHIADRWVTVEDALGQSLARDHEAILKQMCLEKGDKNLIKLLSSS